MDSEKEFLDNFKKASDSGIEDSNSQLVKVYDFDTQKIYIIPASQLGPGMMQVQMNGIEGLVWVDSAKINLNSYQHPPFSGERLEKIKKIKSFLDEVYNLSLEEWEDGFRRDRTPDREIGIWLKIGTFYQNWVKKVCYSMDQKRELLQIILMATTSSKEHLLKTINLSVLSIDEAKSIAEEFYRIY
ncbi:MAG: hypothetical protein AB1489_12490 [Acidobacteriota bacterium]